MKRLALLVKIFGTVSLVFVAMLAISQQRRLNGTVLDDKKKPLEGATISVNKGPATAITKADGKFNVGIPAGKVSITVSYIGYESTIINITESQTSVNITLTESSAKKMDDVVVVGVQSFTKRNSTMAIASVTSKDIENLPSPSIDQLLQGRVAGLNVQIGSGEPGVAPTIVVRGNTKVSTNIGDANVAQAKALSGPLYVIDGIPTNPEDIGNSIDATGTNYLAGININDIESVDVQKDAAATSAWGSRGANGVIYIKTKRGRSATPEFRVNAYGGLTSQPALLNTVTGAEERKQKMDIINQYANY
ncbi:MAG: SusC/RagA family TonB-linked outer membrane protein, partial [Sediminibacterium sp.]